MAPAESSHLFGRSADELTILETHELFDRIAALVIEAHEVLGAGRILRGRQSLIGEKSLPDYTAINIEDRLIHVEESDVDLSHMRNQRQTSNEAAIICV